MAIAADEESLTALARSRTSLRGRRSTEAAVVRTKSGDGRLMAGTVRPSDSNPGPPRPILVVGRHAALSLDMPKRFGKRLGTDAGKPKPRQRTMST
jgi:hypothetical protein